MAERNRQHAAVIESALANIDVVSQLAAFLEAKDLCQVKATCKALGSDDGAATNGLSVSEEAARLIYEGASNEEKATLPRYPGESWIALYHHLLMLRARLTFNQLLGCYVEYLGGDKASVLGKRVKGVCYSSRAICGNHIMRAGKHWATFTTSSSQFHDDQMVGVIRPLPGWETRGLDWFNPAFSESHADLLRERTGRWGGNVHYCGIDMGDGFSYWSDWSDENGANGNFNWEVN